MAAFVTAGCNSVASTVGLENRGQTITAEAWNIIGDSSRAGTDVW